MNTYEFLKKQIANKTFDCMEDAIDAVMKKYRAQEITLSQRNELLNMI
jgi:hypothetical protein